MNRPRIALLQLCPFSRELEAELGARFDVIRWFELSESRQQAWLAERAASAQAVATGGHLGCPNALIDALPALRIVAVNGVGVDKVDLAHARSRNVRVATTPGAPTDDTADLAVGLIIGLLRRIPAADRHVREGRWPAGDRPLARKVTGRRFGIVGLGQIGSAVAARLAPFGPVAYTGPNEKDAPWEYVPALNELARTCDVLIVTCPANRATEHLIDAEVLTALGPQGWLVNVARGSIVDEAALIDALLSGGIAGAALDVFDDEPHVPAALRECENVVLTPHMASATVETRGRMARQVLENLDEVFGPPA